MCVPADIFYLVLETKSFAYGEQRKLFVGVKKTFQTDSLELAHVLAIQLF